MTAREAQPPPPAGRPVPQWRPAIRLAAGLHLAALTVAAVVAVLPGAAAWTREALALDLRPPPGTPTDAATILARNVLVLAPLLFGPRVVAWLGSGRRLLLAYATWQAAIAVVAVGAAVGAYGPPLLSRLTHVPLEWAALAIAIRCSGSSPSHRDAPLVVGTLAGAALLEAFAA